MKEFSNEVLLDMESIKNYRRAIQMIDVLDHENDLIQQITELSLLFDTLIGIRYSDDVRYHVVNFSTYSFAFIVGQHRDNTHFQNILVNLAKNLFNLIEKDWIKQNDVSYKFEYMRFKISDTNILGKARKMQLVLNFIMELILVYYKTEYTDVDKSYKLLEDMTIYNIMYN